MTTPTSAFPSGEQYEISCGEHVAVVTEVGATLRSYSVAGRDVVRGFGVEEEVHKGHGQQLLPWPNRIRDGRYTFGGTEQQLALSEPDRHNAIHGLVRHVAWDLVEKNARSVRQRVVVRPQIGWSGTLEATITHTVGDDGLEVEVSAVNLGREAVPFGYAAHPYLTVGEKTVDEVQVKLPAGQWLEVDDRLLPVALHPVDAEHDLREIGRLGGRSFDTAFTDLKRNEDGRWRVCLRLGERRATLWADQAYSWLQVFTGDHLRNISMAVEPMTCGPDAFNPGVTHDSMLVLEPGGRFAGTWGISGR